VSTKPTAEATESAKGRNRQIDEAFEEASKIAGSNLAPTEFYEQFLNRTLSAINAHAGVVWLRTPQGFLQIACQVNLDKVGLEDKRGGRQCHNEILRQVFQSQPPRPVMVEPQGRLTGMTAEAGAVPAANLTDFYTLFAPIVTADKQSLGLLEVFQEPSLDPRMYQTLLQYTVQMAGYASQYHHFAGARNSSGLEKLFTQIESFAKLIHTSLNPTEVAYHVANEGRRLIECDRLCVGVRHGKGVTVEAVSGADVVEKASTHVRRMRLLFDAVIKFNDKLIYKGVKDDGLPPDLSHALDEYLAESQPKLLVIAPIRDEREKDDKKPARAVLLMESFNPPEVTEPLVSRMEVVGKHAASALYNAAEMKRIPFGVIWRPLGKIQEGLGGKNRFIAASIALGIMLLAGILVLVPWPLKMEAKGEFLPRQTLQVYPTIDGEVRGVLVKSGDTRKEGSPLVSMFSPVLQEKYTQAERELSTATLQIQDYEQMKSRGGLPIEREQELSKEINKLRATVTYRAGYLKQLREMHSMNPARPGEFSAVTPRFDPKIPRGGSDEWRVLSGDIHNTLGNRTVRQSEALLRLGVVEGPWRIELKIPQRNIGHVSKALATQGRHHVDKDGKKYLDVDVLLTGSPDTSYPGRLYEDDMAREAIPNRDDHNESEPIVLGYVRVNLEEFGESGQIPKALFIAGQEAHTRIRCGDRAMGYALFHGVWEWFFEKVVFFF